MRAMKTRAAALTVGVATICGPPPAVAQSTPAFDVASIRHNVTGSARFTVDRQSTRFVATNVALQTLIQMAYGIDGNMAQYLLLGGTASGIPCTANCVTKDEILRARFDIQATVPEGSVATGDQLMLMLRRLLTERFNLDLRRDARALPIYAVTLARAGQLGPQLRPSVHNCSEWQKANSNTSPEAKAAVPLDSRGQPLCQAPGVGQVEPGTIRRRSAGELRDLVYQIRLDTDRPLVDRTELQGNFEWDLAYASPAFVKRIADGTPLPAPKAPELEIALREQLGLRLVQDTAPFETLTIVSARMPTPN